MVQPLNFMTNSSMPTELTITWHRLTSSPLMDSQNSTHYQLICTSTSDWTFKSQTLRLDISRCQDSISQNETSSWCLTRYSMGSELTCITKLPVANCGCCLLQLPAKTCAFITSLDLPSL